MRWPSAVVYLGIAMAIGSVRFDESVVGIGDGDADERSTFHVSISESTVSAIKLNLDRTGHKLSVLPPFPL